jgi:hypothetical protein
LNTLSLLVEVVERVVVVLVVLAVAGQVVIEQLVDLHFQLELLIQLL